MVRGMLLRLRKRLMEHAEKELGVEGLLGFTSPENKTSRWVL